MSLPPALTRRQATVLAAILPLAEGGVRMMEATRVTGEPEHCIRYVLEVTGCTGAWPPSIDRLRALLALPVSDRESRRDRKLAGGPETDTTRLTGDQIELRRAAARAAREAHERRWIDAEAIRYPGARITKPLSAMPL